MATYTISIKNEAGATRQQGLYLFEQAPVPSGTVPLAWFSVPPEARGRADAFNYTIDYGVRLGLPGCTGLPALAPDYRVPATLTLQLAPDGGPATAAQDAGPDAASQAANSSHV